MDGGDFSFFSYGNGQFYVTLFMLRTLGTIDFPLIGESVEDDLVILNRPCRNTFDIYQDTNNVIAPETLTMILRGLWSKSEDIDKGRSIPNRELLDSSVLGLSYVAGPRPSQFDKLKVGDIKTDVTKKKNKGRYAIAIPYAKKGKLTDETERMDIAIPYEVANIIFAYIKENKLETDDKLFPSYACSTQSFNQAINRQILKFSPEIYQRLVKLKLVDVIRLTLTQFRHNAAHSMAMSGASADDIAFILGHSSKVVARHYIMATPQLARVRYRALGINATWQNMMSLLSFGGLTSASKWHGRKVAGIIGGQLICNIGGCNRNCDKCPFSEVRTCYSCIYFRPFIEGNHKQVLYGIQKEIILAVKLSDDIGDSRNPVVNLLVQIKEDVLAVMKRIENRIDFPATEAHLYSKG